MRRLPPALRPGPSGLAAAMLVAGHAITYVLVVASPSARERLLAVSGHGYWRTAVLAAFVFGVYGAGRTVADGIRRTAGAPARYTTLVRRFAALGAASFVALEVSERLASGAPLGDLIGRGIVPIGLVVQAVLALAAAAVVRLLYQAGVAAASGGNVSPRPRLVARVLRPSVASLVPTAVADGGWGVRGPPSS
jgi:hypothetical protein